MLICISENERNKVRIKVQEAIKRKLKFNINDEEDIKALKDLKKNENVACIHTNKKWQIVQGIVASK